MRTIVVRLSTGNAFKGKADKVEWKSDHGSAHAILSLSTGGRVIAEFQGIAVVGWWWSDAAEVVK